MKIDNSFLEDKVAMYDLVLVEVVGNPKPQVLEAKVNQIYSSRKGIKADFLNSKIEFIHSPENWGSVALKVGQRALLFVSDIAGKLYEGGWQSHMVIDEIEGDLYAIYNHPKLWVHSDVPKMIKDGARQDPKNSNATAIPFASIESYLKNLIKT